MKARQSGSRGERRFFKGIQLAGAVCLASGRWYLAGRIAHPSARHLHLLRRLIVFAYVALRRRAQKPLAGHQPWLGVHGEELQLLIYIWSAGERGFLSYPARRFPF